MPFFENQLLDDSDHVEDQFLFEVMHLPRNKQEADRFVKKFEDEATHWVYDEDEP